MKPKLHIKYVCVCVLHMCIISNSNIKYKINKLFSISLHLELNKQNT